MGRKEHNIFGVIEWATRIALVEQIGSDGEEGLLSLESEEGEVLLKVRVNLIP